MAAPDTDAERIERLKILCEQLEVLRAQADDICKSVTTEIRRARIAGQRERRVRNKKVKRDRRQKA